MIKRISIVFMLAFSCRAADVVLGKMSDLSWIGSGADKVAIWAEASSPTTDFGAWFHVDASVSSSMVVTNTEGTDYVYRWNDWRGNGRYAWTSSPDNIPPNLSDSSTPEKKAVWFTPYHLFYETPVTLYWSENCTNIRAVFSVFRKTSLTADYTPFLGHSTAVNFHGSTSSNLFQIADFADVKYVLTGTNRVNGVVTQADSITLDPSLFYVISVRPSDNVVADNFAKDRGNRSGGQAIAECLVFTNTVNDTTAAQIEQYLMTKWGIH